MLPGHWTVKSRLRSDARRLDVIVSLPDRSRLAPRVEISFGIFSPLHASRLPDRAFRRPAKMAQLDRVTPSKKCPGRNRTTDTGIFSPFLPLGESALPSGDVRQARAKTRQGRYAEARSCTVTPTRPLTLPHFDEEAD